MSDRDAATVLPDRTACLEPRARPADVFPAGSDHPLSQPQTDPDSIRSPLSGRLGKLEQFLGYPSRNIEKPGFREGFVVARTYPMRSWMTRCIVRGC